MTTKKASRSLCELKQQQKHQNTLPCLSIKKQGRSKTLTSENKNSANPEHDHYGYNQATLKKIIEINENYLTDKVTISEVMRPSRYEHKMPSKTGYSEYNRRFNSYRKPHNFTQSTPKRDTSGGICKLPDSQINGFKSTYHADYRLKTEEQLKHLSKKQKFAIKKYEKSQVPTFSESSYHRDYHSIMALPFPKAQCPEMQLVQFGKFVGDTTYRQNFRYSSTAPPQSPKPIVHKDNKIFISINNPQNSSYQQTFKINNSPIVIEKSCKPNHKYNPHQPKMKVKTQYSDTFVEQTLFRRKQFECLNNAELKSYVMNILND